MAERFSYEPPWPSYSLAWCSRPELRVRLAVGSFENESSHIQVVDYNEETQKLEVTAEAEDQFPHTKLMWKPYVASDTSLPLLASTSTTLKLWRLEDGQLKLRSKLPNTRTQQGQSGAAPPLTSFDWSTVGPHKLGASSVDTTCTIWNLEKGKIETQLIAHDKAVYDFAFASTDSLFASVGADGSVRVFDQRNLDHSTIIYEASPPTPLLRLAWNKLNANYIATIAMDIPGVILIDVRRPSVALATLVYQESCVNHIAWAPHSRDHLLCGTEDGFALIWDVKDASPTAPAKTEGKTEATPTPEPATKAMMPMKYDCTGAINQVQWPAAHPEYVALGMTNRVEVLQV